VIRFVEDLFAVSLSGVFLVALEICVSWFETSATT